jgi:hypothetical protein
MILNRAAAGLEATGTRVTDGAEYKFTAELV